MSTHCRRKTFHFVGERVQTDRAIVEGDVPVCVLPGHGVLEPILVIALRKVITSVCASRFRAGNGGMSNHDRLLRQVGELERRHQRDVPLQRGVIDRHALQRIPQVRQPLHALPQGIFAAEHADISTGGIGAFGDWTLTLLRTGKGEELFNAMEAAGVIETRPIEDDPGAVTLLNKLSRISRKRWPATAVPMPGRLPASAPSA